MKIKDTLNIKGTKLIFGNPDTELDFANFSKDSRLVKPGDIFIGIKGENFDGNDYFNEAFDRGATTCILCKNVTIKDKSKYQNKNLIVVDDIKTFLTTLAKPICDNRNIPVIAVTGSVGKTSTKNIIASVLSTKYKVLKTDGNLNTLIGLALTFLRLKDEEIIVLEMGMNQKGEISILSNFVKPDVAVITNVGTAHIGNLGSRENILQAKLEILEGLKGPLIINNDNDILHNWLNNNHINNQIITYGIDNSSDYEAKSISYNKEGSHFTINNENFNINVLGKHFIYNSLVAYAIAKIYNIETNLIINKLQAIPLEANRMELINYNNITIINDTYNASYDSVYYALEVLSSFSGRKIAVLGDIFELGDFTEDIHRKIGALIPINNIDILITVGKYSTYINEEALKLKFNQNNVYHFTNNDEAINFINNNKQPHDTYLIKASNGMKFIDIVKGIKN